MHSIPVYLSGFYRCAVQEAKEHIEECVPHLKDILPIFEYQNYTITDVVESDVHFTILGRIQTDTEILEEAEETINRQIEEKITEIERLFMTGLSDPDGYIQIYQ